jgi:ABC-type nitrate/sulfonate/bicarbonate transport system substrate-binding protein
VRGSRRVRWLAAIAVAGLVVAACGGDNSSSSGAASSSAGSATSAAIKSGPKTKVRFALDWTPNTNHTGLYVAQAKDYFADAGLDVEILPYSSASPDTLVGSGAAEFGISFQGSFSFSKSAGTPITSVMAVLQHTATGIGVKADRADINSPKDLDGKTYAGFGSPGENETITQVIKNAGGKGDFSTVTLSTAAYDAVYSGQADFTVPFLTWEAIEAKLRGTPFKTFKYTDYGFPDEYEVIVIGNDDWLAKNPEVAKAFIGALQKGYQYGVANPKEAGQILIDQNPGAFSEPDLVFQSQDLLAASYFPDASGKVGTQTLDQWKGYSSFLYKQGLLVDGNGKALTTEPDYSTWFTDDYLPAS